MGPLVYNIISYFFASVASLVRSFSPHILAPSLVSFLLLHLFFTLSLLQQSYSILTQLSDTVKFHHVQKHFLEFLIPWHRACVLHDNSLDFSFGLGLALK